MYENEDIILGKLKSTETSLGENVTQQNIYDPIIKKSELETHMNKSSTNRMAIIGIGDSNQCFNGTGLGLYFAKHMLNKYGCFGTGVIPFGRQWGGDYGGYYFVMGYGNATNSGKTAPDELAQYGETATHGIGGYWYLNELDVQFTVTGLEIKMQIQPNHPIGIKNNIKFRMSYGTFQSGSANSFTPRVRLDGSPYTTLADGTAINPITGSYGVVDYSVNVAADASRALGLMFTPCPIGSTMKGNALLYYGSAENISKSNGISYQTFLGHAGGSAYDFLNDINEFGTTALNEYIRQVMLTLGTTKLATIVINAGMNDQNAVTTNSHGTLNSTKQGYKENIKDIITLFQNAWVANGGTLSNLYFLLYPSHPVAYPDNDSLISYRIGSCELARELTNVSSIVITNIDDNRDFVLNDWYDAGGNYHLKNNGYDSIIRDIVNCMRSKGKNSSVSQKATIDFGSASAQSSLETTVTVVGAQVGQEVRLVLPSTLNIGLLVDARVTAVDTVTVRATNVTASPIDPASADYVIKI